MQYLRQSSLRQRQNTMTSGTEFMSFFVFVLLFFPKKKQKKLASYIIHQWQNFKIKQLCHLFCGVCFLASLLLLLLLFLQNIILTQIFSCQFFKSLFICASPFPLTLPVSTRAYCTHGPIYNTRSMLHRHMHVWVWVGVTVTPPQTYLTRQGKKITS